MLSVVVLEPDEDGLAELLAGQADVSVERVASVQELATLVKRRFPHQSKVGLTVLAAIPIPTSGLWPSEGHRGGPKDLWT